ncbi:unnamed protein product, partial [Nesidiocoris tenuis]
MPLIWNTTHHTVIIQVRKSVQVNESVTSKHNNGPPAVGRGDFNESTYHRRCWRP